MATLPGDGWVVQLFYPKTGTGITKVERIGGRLSMLLVSCKGKSADPQYHTGQIQFQMILNKYHSWILLLWYLNLNIIPTPQSESDKKNLYIRINHPFFSLDLIPDLKLDGTDRDDDSKQLN